MRTLLRRKEFYANNDSKKEFRSKEWEQPHDRGGMKVAARMRLTDCDER